MAGNINRNPWEMKEYAKKLDTSVELIRDELTNNHKKILLYSEKMDSNCKKAVRQFEEQMTILQKQLSKYEELSEMMRKNANAMIDVYDNSGI